MQNQTPRPLLSPTVRRVLWLLALLAALAWYGNFRVIQPLRGQPFTGALHGNDFKHIYLGAWMLARGQTPYDNPYDPQALQKLARSRGFQSVNPYVYLPFTGLVLSPLTLLDPPDALRCWFWLNHLFLAAAFFLMFHALRLSPNLPNLAAAVAVAALCYPFHRTLTAGQLNCALLFLFALVFALENSGRPVLAGAVAAFAFLFKLTPGILLLYFLWSAFLRRRPETAGRDCGLGIADCGFSDFGLGISDGGLKKGEVAEVGRASRLPASSLKSQDSSLTSAGAMIAIAALLMLVSIAWVGIAPHRAFLPLLKQMSYGQSTWAQFGEAFYRDPYNQSLNSFFHHILVPWRDVRPWLSAGADWANMLTRIALLVCVVATVWRTWPSRAGRSSPRCADRAILFALFILLSLLVPSIYWDHYAVIALWPLFACYGRLAPPVRPWSTGLMVALTLLLGGILELTPLRLAFVGLIGSHYQGFHSGCGMLILDILLFLPIPFLVVWGTRIILRIAEHRPQSGDALWLGIGLLLVAALTLTAAILILTGFKILIETPILRGTLLATAATTIGLLWQGQPAFLGAAWSLAGACLLARFPYGFPAFHHGLGLIPMSLVLWGKLILFGLCLALKQENSRPEAVGLRLETEDEG